MKAALFKYLRAESVDHALALLAEHGDDSQVLAGGQSLVPMLAMRLARPSVVIDINHLGELVGASRTAEGVTIGALTRHRNVGSDALIATHAAVFAKAVPFVAHEGIRNRGTLGGALALGDPAAEFPACAIAASADIRLKSAGGARAVPAEHFYAGSLETARRPDEMVVSAEIPGGAGKRSAVVEIAPRAGDYATVGIAAVGRVSGRRLDDVRLCFFGTGDRPILASSAAAHISGADDAMTAVADAAEAARGEIEVIETPLASAALRRHLVGIVLARAVKMLFDGASE